MSQAGIDYSGVMGIVGYHGVNFAALDTDNNGSQLYVHSVLLWNEFMEKRDFATPDSDEITEWMREIKGFKDKRGLSFGFFLNYEPRDTPDFKVTINPFGRTLRLKYTTDPNDILIPAKANLKRHGYTITEAQINRESGRANLARMNA